jgi:hypothetical protein
VLVGEKTDNQQAAIENLSAELRSRYAGAEISGLSAPKQPNKPKPEDSANAELDSKQAGLAEE